MKEERLRKIEEEYKVILEWIEKRREKEDWFSEEQRANMMFQFGRIVGMCDLLLEDMKKNFHF